MESFWQGVTICGLITEVKQLWAWLVVWWVTVWDTLVAAKDVIDISHVLLWLMLYETYWNMPNHHTSICHEWVYKWVLHWKAKWKRGIASYEMANLYAPQGVDLREGGSPSRKVEWHSMERSLSRKIVKWHLKIYKKILSVLYKCNKWNIN